MSERTFTITEHTADEAVQPDGRHPSVDCLLCGSWAQVLPDGDDSGHFDDLGEFGTGVLSEDQERIHMALGQWSRSHAETHAAEEHADHARPLQPTQEVKL